MALTLQACLEEVDRLAAVDRPLDEIARGEIVESVARAALLGARGNSGVILSQLIRGAAEELVSRPGELIDPVLLGAAMARAAQRAYASVRAPAEGTMLTVMRDMAAHVASRLAHMDTPRLGAGRRGRRAGARAGRHPRGGDRRRRGLGAPRARAAAGPARGRRGRRRRLRRDRHLRRGRRRAARRGGGAAARAPRAGADQPSRAPVLHLSLLHELRRHRRRPRRRALRRRPGGAGRLGARRRRSHDAEGPRPHRRPRDGDRGLRRRRRGVAPRRRRHARAGRPARCPPGRQRPLGAGRPHGRARRRLRAGHGAAVRVAGRPRPRRRADAQPLDARAAGRHPLGPRRGGRRPAQQRQRDHGGRARRRAGREGRARGRVALAAGRAGRAPSP